MNPAPWMLVSGYVILMPLAFVFCGPFFRKSTVRLKTISWFSLISVVWMGFLYLTAPELRIQVLIWAGFWILASILGLTAAALGWHLGPRSRKVLERIVGAWMKFLEFWLSSS
jgi:hypothetical protein